MFNVIITDSSDYIESIGKKAAAEAIKNLKIDKITVWDSDKNDAHGSTTANFLSGFVKSLLPLHEIA